MTGFADAPLIGPGSELQLTLDGRAVADVDVVLEYRPEPAGSAALEFLGELLDEHEVGEEPDPLGLALAPAGAREENLYVAGERLAARAASPATRKQYASIYRTFGDWLRAELDRPPVTSDLTGDAIAAFGRHLEVHGGRGGGPASPATRRVYLNMVRALARDLGLQEEADRVRVPRHRAGPPKTLTDTDYANLLRVPDRRAVIGKRDVALLRVLGDCGLRSAELRGLLAGDLRRPRSNAKHFRLFIRGKGGVEREVDVPAETQAALDAWLGVHPLARGRGLRDDERMFVRLGRHRGREEPEALSAQAVYKLVNHAALAAGVPERLCHPHALRSYWATSLLTDGIPAHVVQAGLGHADLRTTGRYAVVRPDHQAELVDVLDRRHQDARRTRR